MAFDDIEDQMHHVGVDGCKAGWIAVTRGREGMEYAIFSDVREMIEAYADAERILIDMCPLDSPGKAHQCGRATD